MARVARIPGEARRGRRGATRPRCGSRPPTPCRSRSCRAGCAGWSRTTTAGPDPAGLRRAGALRGHAAAEQGAVRAEPRPSAVVERAAGAGLPVRRVGSDLLLPVSAPDPSGAAHHALARCHSRAPVPLLSYSAESGLGRILREVRGAVLERCRPTACSGPPRLGAPDHGSGWPGHGMVAADPDRDDLASGRLVEAAPGEWTSSWRSGSTGIDPQWGRRRRISGRPCVRRRSSGLGERAASSPYDGVQSGHRGVAWQPSRSSSATSRLNPKSLKGSSSIWRAASPGCWNSSSHRTVRRSGQASSGWSRSSDR